MTKFPRIIIVLLTCIVASMLLMSTVQRYVLRPSMAREEILDAYRTGQLTADKNNVIALPPKWLVASEDGKAYLRIDDQKVSWILFVTQHSPTTFAGYLACPVPNKTGYRGMVDVNYLPRGLVTVQVSRTLSPFIFEVKSMKASK